MVSSALFVYTVPKGDAYIGLSQPQSKLTVPAGRTVEEGWYLYVDLFQNKHLTSKFKSQGIHAVLCWQHAKSKYDYLALQIK